jgi:Toprim-like
MEDKRSQRIQANQLGGDIIDFGTRYFSCSVSEFLIKLEQQQSPLSFHPHRSENTHHVEAGEKKIKVVAANPLEDHRLCRYLRERRISLEIANEYVREISFELNGKIHKAIGLQNDSGGWELRNDYFKGSASPKDTSFIQKDVPNNKELIVVEGMFDLLSYLHISTKLKLPDSAILVLNSLSFFERARQRMEQYGEVHLYLDRDHAGRNLTQSTVQSSNKYFDKSNLYQGYKDLNDWLVKNYPHPTQKLNQVKEPKKRRRRHLRL